MNHSEEHWERPFEFLPERFLDGGKFKNDRPEAMQPFSLGPRNCIGRK
jgi:cytochrome P450